MKLRWEVRYWTVRHFNKDLFDPNDPEGDVAWSYDLNAYSGSVKVATLSFSVGHNEMYYDLGSIASVDLRSRFMPKKYFYSKGRPAKHPSSHGVSSYVPAFNNVKEPMKIVEEGWEAFLKKANLSEI